MSALERIAAHNPTIFRVDGANIYLRVRCVGASALAYADVAVHSAAAAEEADETTICVAKVGAGNTTPGSNAFHQSARQKVLGVAVEAIPAGSDGYICVDGLVDCDMLTAVGPGTLLRLSGTAGKAEGTTLFGNKEIFGVALETGSGIKRAEIHMRRL